LLPVLPGAALVHHVYSDDTDLPDIEPFIRFELPATGRVYDARGTVLISVAREYRRTIGYGEVPEILRHAILSAEDKNFFDHGGVDYGVLPRVAQKTLARTVATWWSGDESLRLRLPQGGSTLTQQLVRGYFLKDRTSNERSKTHFDSGWIPRMMSMALGVPTTNKLLRKVEEARLAIWLEREMERRYGSRERAKREIFSRYASFVYLGNGRYGFAAASEYYFGRTLTSNGGMGAGEAALLAGIGKSPRDYAPARDAAMPFRRRNEILALMLRNGFIPDSVAIRSQAEPIRVSMPGDVKTSAPSAINSVLDELKRHGGDRFGIEDLFQGRVSVHTTVDERVQSIVNEALEHGLDLYEERHPESDGLVQGSVVVLRNSDAGILAEAGGREIYQGRRYSYYDFNRVRDSMRQPGSAWKPILYLAAFRNGLGLDSSVPDELIDVPTGLDGGSKWTSNSDGRFEGTVSARQALAESRNTVAVWLGEEVGMGKVIRVARELGIGSPLNTYVSAALGASEVRLLELAGAYRAMASGIRAEPHIVAQVNAASGRVLYRAAPPAGHVDARGLSQIQEGMRGVIRIPGGTAHVLDRSDFPIAVMGKTGTTNDARDALFVGSTYGADGITVAVRIGFDDNRSLGPQESGGRTALPIFREIMLRIYGDQLMGSSPRFPREIEEGIDGYIAALPVELPIVALGPSGR
jgi:penicillin-binding protein 1A